VYLRNGTRELTRVRTDGSPPTTPDSFATDAFLGRYVTRFRAPLPVEYLDPSWERPRLDAESRALLSIPGLAVCVPIAAPDRLIGLVLLGQKRSGLVYRRADNELLETFADQVGLVIENADLIQSSLEKERLKNEVMLARDIQQALLPETPPRMRDIEIRGHMVSSTEVGGDYFDYFALDDDRVVVAIGDVSGKGIPAAMLSRDPDPRTRGPGVVHAPAPLAAPGRTLAVRPRSLRAAPAGSELLSHPGARSAWRSRIQSRASTARCGSRTS
jgi:hypothetical protein